MIVGMKLSPTERKLFKEAVIREYKLKQESKKKNGNVAYNRILKTFKKIVPFNLAAGFLACAGIVYLKGWETLGYVFLSGIFWMTITSTFLASIFKPK